MNLVMLIKEWVLADFKIPSMLWGLINKGNTELAQWNHFQHHYLVPWTSQAWTLGIWQHFVKQTLPNASGFLKDKTLIVIKAFECTKLGSDANEKEWFREIGIRRTVDEN